MKTLIRAVTLVTLLVSVSCGGCNDPELLDPCEPGEVEACFCSGRMLGIRECDPSGTYGTCQCEEPGDEPDGAMTEVDMGPPPDPPGCIVFMPMSTDFGSVAVTTTATRPLEVFNCSFQQELVITDVSACDGDAESCSSGGVFDAELPEGALRIRPLESGTVNALFSPTAAEQYNGLLEVESAEGKVEATELTGLGNECAVAMAAARLEGTMNEFAQDLVAEPLSTVEFSAEGSFAPSGAIEGYQWTVLQRPPGSTATFAPGPDVADPTLFIDLAGSYTIVLEVTDADGSVSCGDPPMITINSAPIETLHMQLVWDTPNDDIQTDGVGSDLDLHFMHPLGTWNEAPYDIFWGNRTGEWGLPGPDDNPSLDIDDINGAGPENINLAATEPDATYQVAVYYFQDHGFGPSNATTRIYVNGANVFEDNMILADTGSFWAVATIDGANLVVTPVGALLPGFP